MAWSTIVPAIITAAAAFLGVGYGARLSTSRETLNWTREQRLKAYAELLQAVEKCYEAFELIAASLDLAKYNESVRQDPKIINAIKEWGEWDSAIERYLPQAGLICSKELEPYIMYARFGIRSRHRVLLMKLAYEQEINQEEWKSVSSMTHGDILDVRRRLRADITRTDPTLSSFRAIMLRWQAIRHAAARRPSELASKRRGRAD